MVQVLLTADPKKKAALSHQAWRRFKAGLMPVGQTEPPERPARPSKPQARQSTVQLAGRTLVKAVCCADFMEKSDTALLAPVNGLYIDSVMCLGSQHSKRILA